MSRINVNEIVNVTAMGFKKNLAAYPRRMEYQGVTYDFIDAGLRCLIRCKGRIAEIFTLSDGFSSYRLRSDDNGANWMLLDIIQELPIRPRIIHS